MNFYYNRYRIGPVENGTMTTEPHAGERLKCYDQGGREVEKANTYIFDLIALLIWYRRTKELFWWNGVLQ